MFFTRKRTILICAIIFVYGAAILIDFVWQTESIVSQQTVDTTESTVKKQRERSTRQNTKVKVADKIASDFTTESVRKNVAFDITQDNEKVFLAFANKTAKKETVAHSMKKEAAKEKAVKKQVVKEQEVTKKHVAQKEVAKKIAAKKQVVAKKPVVKKQEIFHIVAVGDNLWKISKKYYKKTSYQDIQRGVFALAGANPQIRDIDKLNINTQLFIPLASKINLYYKKYLYQIQLSRQMMSSKKITKAE